MQQQKHTIVPETNNAFSISNLKSAAVAIILIEEKNSHNDYSIVFAKRSDKVTNHKGQIAFPGGAFEKDDNSLKETAIRETEEEIGIKIDLNSSANWQYLGQYPKNFISISNYLITPFVFVFQKNGENTQLKYHPDGYEIVEVFEVKLTDLLNPNNLQIEKKEWQGIVFDMYTYKVQNRIIWGITGWLLHDFLTSLPLNQNN